MIGIDMGRIKIKINMTIISKVISKVFLFVSHRANGHSSKLLIVLIITKIQKNDELKKAEEQKVLRLL